MANERTMTTKPCEITPMSILPHPFTTAGRTFCAAAFQAGETIGRYIERNGLALPRCVFNVYHNGLPVPRDLWDRLIPRTGDQVVIRGVGQGGGGDKIIRSVAMIAILAASAWAPGALGLVDATGAWTFGGAAVSGAIAIGGSILVTPLIPEVKA